MTAVGDKQSLATKTFLLGDGEVGKFAVTVGDTVLPVEVKFSAPQARESAWHWEYDGGTLRLSFTGWKNPYGSGLPAPQRIGEVDGAPLGFNMAHQRLGAMNVATLQFYLGGTYE